MILEPLTSAAVDRENPWPGLSSFTEDTSAFFFGREKETDELFRLIKRNTLTVLFGQSGLGKSSLLQAGAFPRLRDADFLPLYLRLDHELTAPALPDQVKAALMAAIKEVGADAPVPRADETLWEYFHRKDIDIWSAKNRLLTPVLAFDQFEEIFTLGRASEAQRERGRAFLTELADLVENRAPAALQEKFDRGDLDVARYNLDKPSCQVVLSLREDFLPDLEGLKHEMRSILHSRMRVKRLNGTQALEIVQKPAPHLLAEGVAEKVVEFVAGARGGSSERLAELEVEPALLSVICRELNERRRGLGQTQITADLVSGNRREILTDFYERSVADLPPAMRAFIEDRLLTKSGFRDNLALETALEEPGVTRPLIDTLVARRLLRIEDRLGVQRVELTHDVLAEVIRASRDMRQRNLIVSEELARVARRTRRLRWIIGGLAAAVVVLCAAGAYGLRSRSQEFARASQLDTEVAARLLEEGKIADGLAYLVRSGTKDPHNPNVAPRLASLLAGRNFLIPTSEAIAHDAELVVMGYSRDGKTLCLAWRDGSVTRIDLATDEREDLPFHPSKTMGGGTKNFWLRNSDDVSFAVFAQETGELVRTVRLPDKLPPITAIWGSPRSDFFRVRFKDNTTAWCDAATGRLLGNPGPEGSAYDTGGDWVGESESTTVIRFFHAPSGQTISIQAAAGAKFVDVEINPQGGQACTIEDFGSGRPYQLRRWSLPEGLPLDVQGRPFARTNGYARYSPDGRFIVLWFDTLEILNGASGQRIALLESAGSYSSTTTTEAFFLPDAHTFATMNSGRVQLWDLPTFNFRALLPQPTSAKIADFSADGKTLVTSAGDALLRLWDVSSGRLLNELTRKHRGGKQVVLAPDGRSVALSTKEGTVYRFQVGHEIAAPLVLPRTPPYFISSFVLGASAKLWWTKSDRAQIIEVASGRVTENAVTFPEPILGISGTAPSRVRDDQKVMLVRTVAQRFAIWWLADGKVSRDIPLIDPPRDAGSIIFSSSRDRVAIFWRPEPIVPANAARVRIWDLKTGQPVGPEIVTLANATHGLFMALSPDARSLEIGGVPDMVNVFDVETGQVKLTVSSGGSTVTSTVFSGDGERILTTYSRGEAQLWNVRTGEPIGAPLLHDGSVQSGAFSPDQNLAVTYSADGRVRFWNARTADPAGEIAETFSSVVRQVSFNADGARFAASANDGAARVWDFKTLLPLTDIFPHGNLQITSVEFSPDGRFLKTGITANRYQLWAVPPALPANGNTPPWLLELATICAGQTLSADGRFVKESDTAEKIDAVRRKLAALPDDAPYVEWGRWFLADPATRSIAPGFTITPAEAAKLAKEMAAAPASSAPSP
jgi:WD40 repeat protein